MLYIYVDIICKEMEWSDAISFNTWMKMAAGEGGQKGGIPLSRRGRRGGRGITEQPSEWANRQLCRGKQLEPSLTDPKKSKPKRKHFNKRSV